MSSPASKNVLSGGELIAELQKSGLRKMLREAEVLLITSVSAPTLWRMVRAGRFPPPSFIAPNAKRWFLNDVIAWQETVYGRDQGEARRQAQRARRKRERATAARTATA